MPITRKEAGIWLRILALFERPGPMSREDKKEAGLKYCRYPGYGYRWCRGRRVPDEYERGVLNKIVSWRETGYSWYQIAAWLLRHGVLTPAGLEWSPSRVRRACLAEMRRREVSGG